MKLLLHGAINMSNFGDYIFAELFYYYARKKGNEVEFYKKSRYGISDYFCKYLEYVRPKCSTKVLMENSDALVYIPGGYFTEPLKKGILNEYRHIERYCKPALYFMQAHKPIYVLGVGAGPFTKAPFSRISYRILNYANTVYVRDDESKQYCQKFGITSNITVTADSALLVRNYLETKKHIVGYYDKPTGKKCIFLHIDDNRVVKKYISSVIRPAVEMFLDSHKEYVLYLGADGEKNDSLYDEYAMMFSKFSPTVLKYGDPWVLCKNLQQSDLILTTKLHVGIIGSSLGTSVVSMPYVPQKTMRFYRQIGESDRCIPMVQASSNDIYDKINKYADVKIYIPDAILQKAEENIEALPLCNTMDR